MRAFVVREIFSFLSPIIIGEQVFSSTSSRVEIESQEISDIARIRKTFARDWIRSSGNYSILDGIVSPLKENYKRNIREKNNEIAALTRNTFRSRRSTT